MIGGNIPTHAVGVFYVLVGMRPFGFAGARVPHLAVSGLTWLMSWAVAAGCCGDARAGWWFQVVFPGLGVFLVA